MGSRANFIVIGDDGLELYYDHWGAQGLSLALLLDGPDASLRRIRSMQRHDPALPDGWLDDKWADGGVVLDLPARTLKWFDFESVQPRLACYLFERTWRGWTPIWCPEGMHGFLPLPGLSHAMLAGDHQPRTRSVDELHKLDARPNAGVPGERQVGWFMAYELVPSDSGLEPRAIPQPVFRPIDQICYESVLSVRFEDGSVWSVGVGVGVFALAQFAWQWVVDYVAQARRDGRAGPGDHGEWREPPVGDDTAETDGWANEGLFVDLVGRRLTWWAESERASLARAFRVNWPGFVVETQGENHEWHEREAQITGLRPPLTTILDEDRRHLRRVASSETRRNPAESTTATLRAAGLSVEVNPATEAFVPSPGIAHQDIVLELLDQLIESGDALPPARYVDLSGAVVEPG